MKTKALILIFTMLLLAAKVTGQCDVTKAVGGTTTICTGTGTFVTVDASDATASYQLRDGITNVGTPVTGTGTSISLPTGILTSTTTFNVLVSETSPDCSAQLTQTVTITVAQMPTASAGGSQIICESTPATVSGASASNGVVLWTHNGNGSLSNASSTSPTYNPVASDAGNTVTLTMTVSNNPCTAATATYTITVDSNSEGGTVSSVPDICNGTQPASLTLSGNLGNVLRWEWSASASPFIPNTIDVTSTTLPGSVIGPLTSDRWFRAVVQNGSCSIDYSSIVKINVYGHLAANINTLTTPICYNTSPGTFIAAPSGGGGTYTYLWYQNGSSTGVTTSSFTPGNLTAPSNDFYCKVTTSTCGEINTATRTIIVRPQLTLSGVSQDAQICSGSPAQINLTGLLAGSISTVAYKIGTVTYTPATGVDASAPTPFFLTTDLESFHNGKILQITGITDQGTGCSAIFSNSTMLIVNSATTPTITENAAPCIGSAVTYTSESEMTNYNWQISGGTEGSDYIKTGGGTNENYVTITWLIAKVYNVSVNFTNKNECSVGPPTVKSITVNPLPVPSILSGPPSVCIGSTGNAYTTESGKLAYSWEVPTGGVITSGGAGNVIVVTWNMAGTHKVRVRYSTTEGCPAQDWTEYTVVVNPLPVPSLAGPLTVRATSDGNEYTTDAGMNTYVWTVSSGGTITGGGTLANNTATVTWNTAGTQSVSVKYNSAFGCTASAATVFNVTVNPPPSVSNVQISGTPAIEYTLTGTYTWNNGGAGSDISAYRWLRNSGTLIGSSLTYVVQPEDLNSTITFEVTPVTSIGTPNIGAAVSSSATKPVEDLSEIPVADEVCIEGNRTAGSILKGKYRFIHSKPEGASTYKWFINGVQIPSATENQYTLLPGDIDNNEDITFQVTPVSSNIIAVGGSAVSSSPLARILLPKAEYSVSEKDVALTSNAPGGDFYGPGVSGTVFSPKNAGSDSSPHTLLYVLNIIKSNYTCSQQTSAIVSVLPNVASFNGFNPVYCYDNGTDIITVTGVPGGATDLKFTITNPAGLVSQSGTMATIDPGMMDPGNNVDSLHFSYNYSGSFYKISESFTIDKVDKAAINNLMSGDTICNSRAPFELYPSPLGGVFSSPVVNGTILDPKKLDPTGGNTYVNYTFTNFKTGCSSSIHVPVVINPAPVLSFTVADYCIENDKDITQFINSSTSVDPVKEWTWLFTESNGDIGRSKLESPGYLFKTGGLSRVELTEKTIKNCSSTRQITFEFGSKPVANFYWRDDCLGSNEGFLTIRDTSSGTSAIISREWTIFNTLVDRDVTEIKYQKVTEGYVPVKLVVKTNYLDCAAEITKNIYIRKNISLAADDYIENFESGNGGWVKYDEATQLWNFGTPDRPVINNASSPANAWYTSYSLTGQKRDSASVVSPCFDFSASLRPMFRMQMRTKFDKNADGAVLEYKVGDRMKWKPVGSLDDGINWFNSPSIRFPEGNQTGWTTNDAADTLWKSVANTLTDLAGKKYVKFRIKYGTDGYASDNDGIAFDDIYIGESTRKVLLEHYTNAGSRSGSEATAYVNEIIKGKEKDIINIQYHTNFPGNDLYFSSNPGDASARIFSYGLSKVPYSLIDGGFSKDEYASLSNYKTAKLDSDDLSRRSLMDSRFRISVTPEIAGGVLKVNSSVTAVEGFTSDNLVLYLVVTEKENDKETGALGEKNFYNVFRKFIPDAGGIGLRRTWTKGELVLVPEQTWIIENIKDFSDIEVIAFIQNSQTKEVYQAESKVLPTGKSATDKSIQDKNAIGNEDKLFPAVISFGLYPNPAVGRLTIEFSSPVETDADIRIYDMQGAVKSAFKVAVGESSLIIDDLGLRSGIYLVRITSGGKDLGFRKLIVSGD